MDDMAAAPKGKKVGDESEAKSRSREKQPDAETQQKPEPGNAANVTGKEQSEPNTESSANGSKARLAPEVKKVESADNEGELKSDARNEGNDLRKEHPATDLVGSEHVKEIEQPKSEAGDQAQDITPTKDSAESGIEMYNGRTNINLSGGEIDEAYFGNRQVNVTHNNYNQGNTKATNQVRELAFPKQKQDLPLEEIELLDKRRAFYRDNRWIVLEANGDNMAIIAQAIATLITYDNQCRYLLQDDTVKCEDYIDRVDEFACQVPSITKLKYKSPKTLLHFFDTPENVDKLASALRQGQNRLILVLHSETDHTLKELICHSHKDAAVAYWVPQVAVNELSQWTPENELDWLDKTVLLLCCWFDGMPYDMLYQVVLTVLQQQYETCRQNEPELPTNNEPHQTTASDSGDGKQPQSSHKPTKTQEFALWLSQWRNDPDNILSKLGIANLADADGENVGMRFIQVEHQQRYRNLLHTSASFHIRLLITPVMDYLLHLEQRECQGRHADIFNHCALFLTALHRQRLLYLDIELLSALFEQCRFAATGVGHTIKRFTNLLCELNNIESHQTLVEQFIADLTQKIIQQQANLIRKAGFNMELLNKLPQATAELLADPLIQDIDNNWKHLKDLVYSSYFVLQNLGVNNRSSLLLIEGVLSSNYGTNKATIDTLPCANVLAYCLFEDIKYQSGCLFDLLSAIKDNQQVEQPLALLHLQTELSQQVLELFYTIRQQKFNKKATICRALHVLIELLNTQQGAQLIISLLDKEKPGPGALYMIVDACNYLYLATELIDQFTDDSERTRQAIGRFLHLLATMNDRNDYRKLTQQCKHNVEKVRQQVRDKRSNKDKRLYWQQKIQAVIFVKRHFSIKNHQVFSYEHNT